VNEALPEFTSLFKQNLTSLEGLLNDDAGIVTLTYCEDVAVKLFRYSIVGFVATLAHYLLIIWLVERTEISASLSAGLGASFGAVIGYFGNHNFTFNSEVKHRDGIPRFMLTALLSVFLSTLIVWFGTHFSHLHYLVLQMFATGMVFLFSYRLNDFWTFRT